MKNRRTVDNLILRFSLHRALIGASALLLSTLPSWGAATTLNLAQAPTVSSFKSIAPNLMLLLDDSGSMQFEYLGSKGNIDQYYYGYPLGYSQPYGTNTYSYGSAPFAKNKINAAQYRAAFINPNFYNPAITYTPWACAGPYPESSTASASAYTAPQTGFSCHWDSNAKLWVMENALPNKAYLNPAYQGAGWRSLNVWNDASYNVNNNTGNNGYSQYISTTFGTGDQSKAVTGFWPAAYFNYTGPRPGTSSYWGDISKYQYVQICPPSSSPTTNSNGVASNGTVSAGGTSYLLCSPPPKLSSLSSSPAPYHTYINDSGDYVYIKGDGTQIVRTYSQEMQNFANWYQYYRSHILMANAGISLGFMALPENFRVDFATINSITDSGNNASGTPVYSTTEDFTTSQRQGFLQNLYQWPIPRKGTPSRLALAALGNWLSQTPGAGAPWGSSVAEKNASGSDDLSCRQNYVVFVTDGQWNGGGPSVDNADGSSGPTIKKGPNNPSYQYKASTPFEDSYSDTFADVAFHYWENDLQGTLQNNVPSSVADPGFWQHLDTFAVGLGVTPSLVTAYQNTHSGVSTNAAQAAVLAKIIAGKTLWPDGFNDKIDDLWHGGIDGHGGFFSASNPAEFASALHGTLQSIINRVASSSSTALNTQTDKQYQSSATQTYVPLYHPQNWWGELQAIPILVSSSTGDLVLSGAPNWNASCVLTGATKSSACPTGGFTSNKSQFTAPNASSTTPPGRQILTWNGSQGVPFEWNDLTSTQQTDIGNQTVLDYLRGVRTAEIGQSGGTLRTRTSVLGDIVDSSPKWVGYPNQSYPSTSGQPKIWSDPLSSADPLPENASGAQSYAAFASQELGRRNVVYVGANDGFLHGFSAGNYTLNNGQPTYSSTYNTGQELLAYMPSAVISEIKPYSDPNYAHHFFDDATPGTGNLFYADASHPYGVWHTWLASGLGGGGKDLFMLDITHPSQFSETNAASIVKADWTPTNLTCVNATNCGKNLGYTYGTPLIRRFHNGDWGVIWGNGLNSTNGKAGIFIALINHSTGKISVYYLGTGYGPSQDPTTQSRPDGITYTTAADLDGDHIVDYVYAGDYFGNVWRFNLTSSNPADWHVSTYGNGSATPLFSAVNQNGTPQPITTQVKLVSIPDKATGKKRLLVEFGTGSSVLTSDKTPNTTAAAVQSVYGIWDWNMNQWDDGYTTSSGVAVPAAPVQYDALSAPRAISRGTLQQQKITSEVNSSGKTYTGTGTGNRVITNHSVCWIGSTATCPSGSTANTYGWYLDLISPRTSVGNNGMQGEKVIYNPTIENGVLQFNTTITSAGAGLTCNPAADTGWTMALDPRTGGRLDFEVFYTVTGQLVKISISDKSTITSGITYGAVGTPSYLVHNGQKYMLSSGKNGKPVFVKANLGNGITGGRLTWVQLR